MIILIVSAVVILGLGVWNYLIYRELEKLKSSIVELRDKKPTGKTTKTSNAMKLNNEITPFIYEDGEDIVIKVVKP